MNLIFSVAIVLLAGCVTPLAQSKPSTTKAFRFHIVEDPMSLDPARVRGVAADYVFNNLFRSLYRFDSEKGLVPEGATRCEDRKSVV